MALQSQRIIFLFVIIFTMVGEVFAVETSVENVRMWHSAERTRIVFDVSENVQYKLFLLQQPLRFVTDINGAELKLDKALAVSNNPHIGAIRTGKPRADTLRFVFELNQSLHYESFLLAPNEIYGHRLVIDLFAEEAVPTATAAATTTATNTRSSTATLPVPSVVINESAPSTLLVAVDAGHGGEDPGAIGYRKSREKRITLEIAKRLADAIDGHPEMQSMLVRKGDYYIELHKRRQRAKQAGADIFISIHADAFAQKNARGFSVFALSQRGATSAMASALAAKENASDLIGGVNMSGKDELVRKVLVDLSMTSTINRSLDLGSRVLDNLADVGRLHSRRVEQAGFAVLKSADMPSLLVETGFITNPDEERRLRSSNYQKKIVKAIVDAIESYMQQTPHTNRGRYASVNLPAETTVKSQWHTVVRGDTLSELAVRYRTTVAVLKRRNNLRSDVLRRGQRLRVTNAPSKTQYFTYVVKNGDSLSKISERHNVQMSAIKKINGLRSNRIYRGQKLKIPGSSRTVSHKVKRGDTLSELASNYGVSMAAIRKHNNLASNAIQEGRVLRIPVP